MNNDQIKPDMNLKPTDEAQEFHCRGCAYAANRRDTLQRHRNRRDGKNECILSEILDFLRKVKENPEEAAKYYEELEDDTREALLAIKKAHSGEFHSEWASVLDRL
ncbi:hypothetical protein HDV01_005999 [Terramyces sp. JEL0728]|nr:hypothetical protein HDV01_005999 [Terramyces sp. JEL0728]